MDSKLDELVAIMQSNRRRHGKVWRKLAVDRIPNLFPGMSLQTVEQLVNCGVDKDKLEVVTIEREGKLLPAIKLVRFHWSPRRLDRRHT